MGGNAMDDIDESDDETWRYACTFSFSFFLSNNICILNKAKPNKQNNPICLVTI